MELLVTGHQNEYGGNRHRNVVRIFLQRDYTYGYWIAEDTLFSFLNKEQQAQYVNDAGKFDINLDTAAKILKLAHTPFEKQELYEE